MLESGEARLLGGGYPGRESRPWAREGVTLTLLEYAIRGKEDNCLVDGMYSHGQKYKHSLDLSRVHKLLAAAKISTRFNYFPRKISREPQHHHIVTQRYKFIHDHV